MKDAKRLAKDCQAWPWGNAPAPAVAFEIQIGSETINYDVEYQGDNLCWKHLSFVGPAHAFIKMPDTVLQWIEGTCSAKPRAQVARVRSFSHLYLYAFLIIDIYTRSCRNRSF